jgi:lipoprotein-releasing system permease protein
MAYSLEIGLRYLRSKKRSMISVITIVAITGVALGVGALLAVLSITTGFQEEFRHKVLGVNAHVLVLKYGLDFEEYRDVIAMARGLPEVAGAAPFIINEMMLAKGDRISGVLVKGVDPEAMPTVLDLPAYMTQGSLEGLRRPGAAPAARPDSVGTISGSDTDLDNYLRNLSRADAGTAEGRTDTAAMDRDEYEDLMQRIVRGDPLVDSPDAGTPDAAASRTPVWAEGQDEQGPMAARDAGTGDAALAAAVTVEELPEVDVPTPDEVEAYLRELEQAELPSDEQESEVFAAEARARQSEDDSTDKLPGIVVGATLASNLGLSVDDRVTVISPLAGLDISMFSDAPRAPRSRDFRVIGVFEAGFQEYDSRLVYVDLYEAQGFTDLGDTVTGVEIRLHDLEQAPEVAHRLERQLGGGPFHTVDWEDLNHNLFTALEIQKVMLSLVIATIILVAAFNVIATLIMVVLEKKREIAILKAMGAKDHSILSIFMVQGVVIGVIGTLIGLVVGGGICWYLATYQFPLDPKVYLIDHLPVRISSLEFILTTIIALFICSAATLIPSWWAARLLPADGVRYE